MRQDYKHLNLEEEPSWTEILFKLFFKGLFCSIGLVIVYCLMVIFLSL